MDWWKLSDYSTRLRDYDFDVARFIVQPHKELTFPLVGPIEVMLALPFSILVGSPAAATEAVIATSTVLDSASGTAQPPSVTQEKRPGAA